MACRRLVLTLLLLFLIVSVVGCTTLRYNMVAPEAKGFHPTRIGVFPVDIGSYTDAQGKIDEVIVDVLGKEKKITYAVSIGTLREQQGNHADLGGNVDLYWETLTKLNYSDPELSRKVATIAQVDALVITTLDHLDYLKEGDSKIAKVGLGVKMIDPRTGQPVWEARHFVTEKYLFIKPDLLDVAKKLVEQMVAYMPR